MFNYIRAFYRFTLFILVLTFYVVRLLITGLFKGMSLDLGLRHRHQCCLTMMKVLNIDVQTKGKIYEGNYLYISNHRCYLDPIAQLTKMTALPVAKAEVEKLPIMGYGAKITGVHYVQRESLKSRKETRSSIAETIENGRSILIYPEGTTFNTPTTGDFKPGTFRMAAQNKVKIIPIAIEYGEVEDAWVGPDKMFVHFLKQYGKTNKKIRIHYGDPMWMEDGDELLKAVRTWIDEQLIEWRKELNLPLVRIEGEKD
ncbi:MAG: lysophospholipid acyltransferase family protein [Bacteroidota bacterium]